MTRKFASHLERVRAVTGSLDGRLFAYGGQRDAESVTDSVVHIMVASKLAEHATVAIEAAVGALCFAADDLLVVGGDDGVLRGVEVTREGTAKVLATASLGSPITSLSRNTAGTELAATAETGEVAVLGLLVEGGAPRIEIRARRGLSARPLRASAIEPNGHRVIVAGDDSTIRALPIEGLADAEVRDMAGPDGGVMSLAATDDGRAIVGGGDGSIRLYYLDGAADEEDRSRDAAHTGPVRALVLGPRLRNEQGQELPQRIFSVSDDGHLKSWQLDTRRKPKSVEVGKAGLGALAWLTAGSRAKPEKRGGTLVIADKRRRLTTIVLDEQSDLADELSRLDGRLASLREDMRARTVKARQAAVRSLAEIPEDDARRALDRALGKDDKAEVRALAATLIGTSARRRSRPALRTALDDSSKEVRKAALDALTALESDTPLSPARAALGSRHPEIRIAALRRLPGLRDTSPTVPGLIADRLRDGDGKVRHAALDALEKLEPSGSLAPAHTALDRGPADVRVAALRRLGSRGQAGADNEEGYALVEQALDDEDSEVRRVAFLVAVASRPALALALRRVDPTTHEQMTALEKSGPLAPASTTDEPPTEADRAPLFAALVCRNPDTALRGARAMGVLADGRATGALLQLSREADPAVRRPVVDALLATAVIMAGDERLRTRLRWLLDDADESVRNAAYEALTTLAEPDGEPGSVTLAATALASGHADIRRRALQILVKLPPDPKASGKAREQADVLLGHALDDEDSSVRNEAFRTLWAWHERSPQTVLARASASRHADIRTRVVTELDRQKDDWADELLVPMVSDAVSEVGLAAYKALVDGKNKGRKKKYAVDDTLHLAALSSPRPAVRAEGCHRATKGSATALRPRLVELLDDEAAQVHVAAIEAIDSLAPKDQQAFVTAFGSKFWGLRVRAGELCGKRRDPRAVEPMRALLALPEGDINRPSDELRRRAARALADVGAVNAMRHYVTLLDDADGVVREMGARGLAGAVVPGQERPLLTALSHPDLPVRSWVAEGLARLGDPRAVPVLAGTLQHDHRPIRLGAILSFVALGPDGIAGILQGLEDRDREIQDLVFAVVVARDLALARAGLPPDLLLAAIASSSPEIRLVAARVLEGRDDGERIGPLAQELVGPTKSERAADLKKWPKEQERIALLNVLVSVLASDDPSQRYAAARVLSLRPQPEAFWRELKRLRAPKVAETPDAPATNWEDEAPKPRKRGWVRRLLEHVRDDAGSTLTERVIEVLRFVGGNNPQAAPPAGGSEVTDDTVQQLVFGTYVGLVRQAPVRGESDETHRVRRTALGRLGRLAGEPRVGRHAVLPVLRRALSDPHNRVRKEALVTLQRLYDKGDVTPLGLALQSQASDVGRGAVDELVRMAQDGHDGARALALRAVNAPSAEVRTHAVTMIARLFPAGSLEPWLVALGSRHADVRLSVVDRLADSRDDRVDEALRRALESDHEDLRLRAAKALASRGDLRTVEVLATFLRSEESTTVNRSLEALVTLAHARPGGEPVPQAADRAAQAVAARIEDDPDKTADRSGLIRTLGRIGSREAAPVLLSLVGDEQSTIRDRAFSTLVELAKDDKQGPQRLASGATRARFDDEVVLPYVEAAAASSDEQLRLRAAKVLRDVDDAGAETILARLLGDRIPEIRIAACEALAFRGEHVEGASLEALALALREGRRELVLPAAAGLAGRRRPEAFQALLLVLKAAEQPDRERALLALGTLGDRRALEEIEPLLDPEAELTDEDRALAPTAIEALGRMLPHLASTDADESEHQRVRELVERTAREGNSALRPRALLGLRHAGDDRSRSVIEAAVLDHFEDPSIRQRAIDALRDLGSRGSEPTLAAVLDDDHRDVRRKAAAALHVLFAEEPTTANLLALRSQHADVSAPAAAFLAKHGDANTLVARMGEIDNADVRRRLRRGLIRRNACPEAAVRELLRGTSSAGRTDGAWIAGACQATALADDVATAADSAAAEWSRTHTDQGPQRAAHEQAWRACLWASRRLGGQATAAARAAIETTDSPIGVRREALRLLIEHGDASDVDRVAPLLADADAIVRRAAADLVSRHAPGRATELLRAQTVADAATLAPVATLAFESAAGELLAADETRSLVLPVALGANSVDPLVALAQQSGKSTARLTAIGSLGRLGGEPAEQALKNILDQSSEPQPVRKAAFRALRRLQRQRARAAAFANT